MDTKLYKTTGIYFGFIHGDNIFSRDGIYLGWLEGIYIWDRIGNFRGELVDKKYLLRNRLAIPATSRPPRTIPSTPQLPDPAPNITPISPPIGFVDAF